MNEETTVTTTEVAPPAEWHDRPEIVALANRLKAMLPGKKLSTDQALLLAQYSAAMDANPFRGEVYAYNHKGKLILVEGYKLLVRWARRQCNFYERYERITNDTDDIPEDAIAFRCRLLRQDAIPALMDLTQAKVPNAYEIASIEAVGVVTKADRTTRQGEPQAPPTGWTWEAVARKRALKNVINRAYGSPSPREIANETWMVEDTLTISEDWTDDVVTPIHQRELEAKHAAQQRGRPALDETFDKSMADLGFGDDEFPKAPPEHESEDFVEEPPPGSLEEALEAPQHKGWHTRYQLLRMASSDIGYFGENVPHIISTLKKLERESDLQFGMDDDTVFANLNAYAARRADEKAAKE